MKKIMASTLMALAIAATGVSVSSAEPDRDPRGSHPGWAEIEKNLP